MRAPTSREVRSLRKSLDITQREAAAVLGQTESSFRHYETGARTMRAGEWFLFRILTAKNKNEAFAICARARLGIEDENF